MGFVQAHEPLIVLIVSALTFVIFILSLCLFLKLGKLSKSKKPTLLATEGISLDYIENLAQRLDKLDDRLARTDEGQRSLDKRLALSVQRVGLVRFDAFSDVGGEQSFALALLDRDINGVIISCLYGRTESRVYSKEITAGQSQHALSDEEREAVRRARVLER